MQNNHGSDKIRALQIRGRLLARAARFRAVARDAFGDIDCSATVGSIGIDGSLVGWSGLPAGHSSSATTRRSTARSAATLSKETDCTCRKKRESCQDFSGQWHGLH